MLRSTDRNTSNLSLSATLPKKLNMCSILLIEEFPIFCPFPIHPRGIQTLNAGGARARMLAAEGFGRLLNARRKSNNNEERNSRAERTGDTFYRITLRRAEDSCIFVPRCRGLLIAGKIFTFRRRAFTIFNKPRG